MSDFLTSCWKRLGQFAKPCLFFSLLQKYRSGVFLSQDELLALLAQGAPSACADPHQLLARMRSFVSALFLAKYSKQLVGPFLAEARALFNQLEKQSYAPTLQLGAALFDVAATLLDRQSRWRVKPKLESSGAILQETGARMLDGAVVQPVLSAELALIWLYLGSLCDDDVLRESGVKAAHFLLQLCDAQGSPFHAFWVQEARSSIITTHVYSRLLFACVAHLSRENKLQKAAEKLERHIEQLAPQLFETLDPFAFMLDLALQERKEDERFLKISTEFPLKNPDTKTAFLRYAHQNFSVVCSATGVNTGIGALHKGKIKVVSFGPHFFPLANPKHYGLYRTCSWIQDGLQDPLQELTLSVQEETCQLKGWSRLLAQERPEQKRFAKEEPSFSSCCGKDDWMWFDLSVKKKICSLTVDRGGFSKEQMPLAFVFFVIADKMCIAGRKDPLFPKTLAPFRGKSATVTALLDEEQLTITPKAPCTQMEVIPLAGKDYFWGAHFLLAFSFQKNSSRLRWSLG